MKYFNASVVPAPIVTLTRSPSQYKFVLWQVTIKLIFIVQI